MGKATNFIIDNNLPIGTPSSTLGTILGQHLSSNTSDPSASGGFVLYPNKPNTNNLQTVYAK